MTIFKYMSLEQIILTVSALPFRLPLKWLCSISLVEPYGKIGGLFGARMGMFLFSYVNQPCVGLYNWAWGKDGWWHSYYTIEHWPQWLQ